MTRADGKGRVLVAGGGLAGLACGIGLRLAGFEVEVHEKQSYPLKKVCGEFLSPSGWQLCRQWGVQGLLDRPPRPLERARLYYSRSGFVDFRLDPPAWGISRQSLDAALARRFRDLGGALMEGSEVRPETGTGERRGLWVDARGRQGREGRARWLGWKAYLDPSAAPGWLEPGRLILFALKGGYGGLLQVEDGRFNACLITRAPARLDEVLASHPLLAELAPRLVHFASVAGFSLGGHPAGEGLGVGDRLATWPPVVGDGMTAALKEGRDLAGWISRGGREPGEWREAGLASRRAPLRKALWLHRAMRIPWVPALAAPWPGTLTRLYRWSRA